MKNRGFKGLIISLAAAVMAMNPTVTGGAGINTVVTAEAAAAFTISTSASKILKGSSVKLTTNWGGSGSVTWTSSNKKVAAVTAKGIKNKNCMVRAVDTGTAVITGKTADNKKVTCRVRVYEGKFSKQSIKLEAGRGTAVLKFVGGSGKETWKLGNKTTAVLTKKSAHTYRLEGIKPGKTNVVVTDGNNRYKCLVTVVKPGTLKTVKAGAVRSLDFDDTVSFKITNAGGLKVTWKVTAGNSVKITSSSSGNCSVKGIAPGRSTVEAFCEELNKKWVWEVNVKSVSQPYLTQNTFDLTVGDSAVVPVEGYVGSVDYYMNNTNAITLTASGKITARYPGKAIVTVVADGIELKLTVNVKAKEETKPSDPESGTDPSETEKQPESEKQSESKTETESEEIKKPETDPINPGNSLKYTYEFDEWEWTNVNGVYTGNVELAGGEEYYIMIKTDASANDMHVVGTTGASEVTSFESNVLPSGRKYVSCNVYGRFKGNDKVKIYAEGRNLIGELTVNVTSDDELNKQYVEWFENVIKANTGFYDDSLSEMQKLLNCENYIQHHYYYPEASEDGYTIKENSFMLYGKGNCFEASATMIYYAKELMKNPSSQITQAIYCGVNIEGISPSHIVAGIRINGVLCGFDATPMHTRDFSLIPDSTSYQYIESQLRIS